MVNFNREKKRILFVEDNEETWELVEATLMEYKLTYARNFKEGLRIARRGYFDLYLLDNWLPDGSGVELCRAIRKFDPYTPILFYSATAFARDTGEAWRAGAQAYLVKPVISYDLRRWAMGLIFASPKSTFEAHQVEIAAVREEMAIQLAENEERMERDIERRLRSKEKALRDKALIAFLAAGGTRGDFARAWPSVFVEEVRSARASAAVSGH
jgi:DNA-binding response OmpR family regulator